MYQHICNECDYRTKTSELIKLHKESVHNTNPKIKCTQCDFTAHSQDIMKKHNKIAMGHKRNVICKHLKGINVSLVSSVDFYTYFL